MKTQILWSGGVESTSLLKYFLVNTNDAVVAHHVELDNPERRAGHEATTIERLHPHLTSIRPFALLRSHAGIADGNVLPPDFELLYVLGLYVHR